ncbi:MAG: UDP-N-acetylmuramate--L-alanine ligase [Chitinophagia bacterium]|jgi:UDP-N-acetylmuramate--alanine ligase
MNSTFTISSIYFIGIGGIGMSALARYFKSRGAQVSGYDKAETSLTRTLVAEGIAIHYHESLDLIPKEVDVVVYTPAVPSNHIERVFYENNGYRVVKRSDILQWITENSFNICVAGTHGKTTVSTMIAHILRDSQYGCNAFLGGIAANYQTNFWSSDRDVAVIEADEYDRSFLKLSPDIAVITAVDADHLDIYGTTEEVEKAFEAFAGKLKPGGILIKQHAIAQHLIFSAASTITYSGQSPLAQVFATNISVVKGTYHFDITGNNFSINGMQLSMGGLYNIENALAAVTVAHQLGISHDAIRSALANFKGVKRRFEYRIQTNQQVLIDDYAHHPEELKALITGVKSIFLGKPITLVFQPHLFSRTRDLCNEFAVSLDMADEVILLPIYPARELPIEGVSSEIIRSQMKNEQVHLFTKEECKNWIEHQQPGILVMAGAGDIDQLIQEIVDKNQSASHA